MLAALREFFEQRIASSARDTDGQAEHRARVAAAALMIEVVRSDERFTAEERSAVLDSVQRKFALDTAEAAELVALAEAEAREAHDYWQFTSRINAEFTPDQKLRLLEELWRVAYADDGLHRHEEHLIRRVADLLHVSHSAFVRSKHRVREGAG